MIYALIVILGLVGLVWLSRHLELSRFARTQPFLDPTQAPDCWDNPPRISVLVAAKDEEAVIERCVRSLAAQDYPNFELIVIDDRSRDRTAEIVRRIAETDPRCRLIQVTSLREGWFGKNNAMRAGVEQAGGEWLCFSDADCYFMSPSTLSVALRFAIEHKIDFLSVLPNLEMHGPIEKAIQPVCGMVMVFWFRPNRVNNPDSRAAYANGAFMLMTRACYQAIGGHEAVKTAVNEDMHMARRTKQVGRRLYAIGNRGLYQCRMYSSFGAIWRGWSRIFYGCFGTLRQLIISIVFLLVMSVSPYVGLFAGLVWCLADGFGPRQPQTWLLAVSAATVVIQQSLVMRLYRFQGHNPLYALAWLPGALVAIGMSVNAITKLAGRPTNWRDTVYSRDRLVS